VHVTGDLVGYQRGDGRWGFRNHVLVLPLHAAACGAAEQVARRLPGSVSVGHDWTGRGADVDVERVERVFLGFATHPNVAATVMIGLDDSGADMAGAAGKLRERIEFVSLAGCGGTAATVRAAEGLVGRWLEEAARVPARPAPVDAISLALECGGSDALSGITANPALGIASDLLVGAGGTSILGETSELIGAEHLLARRAATPAVGGRLLAMIDRFERNAGDLGVDLRGGQPVPGNIAGGLTTIEEKSLGAAKKGGNAPIQSVLEYAEAPRTRGLHVMDTPGNDIEQMVGMVAAGCQIVAFTTGRGTPTGSPIAPCIKIATNSSLYFRLTDDLDLNAGTALDEGEPLAEIGERIYRAILATAAGQPTAAERHRDFEFSISREQPRWQPRSA
jgi:altronate dehydratase large subunit